MDGPGHQVFACPALTRNQHGGLVRRAIPNLIKDLLHGTRRALEKTEGCLLGAFAFRRGCQANLSSLGCATQDNLKYFLIYRGRDEVYGSLLKGLYHGVNRIFGRNNDNGSRGRFRQ